VGWEDGGGDPASYPIAYKADLPGMARIDRHEEILELLD